MYRIMLVAKEGINEVGNLYKFLTMTDPDGQVIPYEANTLEELDAQVEKMLNGKYAKKDIMVVQTKNFEIGADLYEKTTETSDTESNTATEEEAETETETTT